MQKTINITKSIAIGAGCYSAVLVAFALLAMVAFYAIILGAQWLIIASYEGWITEQQMWAATAGLGWIIISAATLKTYRAVVSWRAHRRFTLYTMRPSPVRAISLRRLYSEHNFKLSAAKIHQEKISAASQARPANQLLEQAQ